MVHASLNLSAQVDKSSIFYCEYCTMYSVHCTILTIINGTLINPRTEIQWSVHCTLYSVRFSHCTLYSDCTILNNKWNSYRPAHWDSMNRVPLKNPIYYCEYYRGIMFQFPPNDILYLLYQKPKSLVVWVGETYLVEWKITSVLRFDRQACKNYPLVLVLFTFNDSKSI